MDEEKAKISQLKVQEPPANCPVPPPCPVCPPRPKPTQILLKILLVLGAALLFAAIILVGSGLRISKGESLLDIWLASRRGISPTPEVLATPTPNPTADWKTYENTTFGYLLKYPNNWNKASEKVDRGTLLLIDRPIESYLTQEGADIAVWVEKKTKQEFDSLYNQEKRPSDTTVLKKFMISGEPAIMLSVKYAEGTIMEGKGVIEVDIHHNGNLFQIGLLGPVTDVEKNKVIFDQILSTFKFTE